MPIYKFNGDVYDIPQEKQAEFESQFPDASISYTAGADQYDIPVSKREDFLKDFPDAQLYTLETQPASNTYIEDNVEMEDFPMFDDEPQVQEQPQAERGFAAGARESWKGLKAGFQNLWGETANVFTGSSQDSINALNELNDMVRQGKDVAAETEDAWTDAGREIRTGAMEFLPEWMIKGWKNRVADKAEKQKVLDDIREALVESGGDVDKARELLEQRAQDQSYGDIQIERAAEKFADIKPTEGFGAWVGSNVVQMIPSASALIVGALTKSPSAAKAIGTIGMVGMTASTAGTSMYEARETGASDSKTWRVGVTDGMIEYLTEKLPFDRYTSRIMGKVKSEVAQDLFSALSTNKATRTELENLLIKANDRLGGKLFSKKNLKDYVADMLAEGASEFSAEALQTMTSMMYEEPENYPTINEILTNGWEGAKAGFFMGAVLGGASKTMEHSQNRQRRMDKGSVDIALVDMGNGEKDVAEVVEYDAKSNTAVILRDGAFESVSGSAISDGYRFSYEEFEKARLRQMEDEAIVSGNVNEGQIKGMEETISKDIEEIRALAPDMSESEISAILQSEMSVDPETPLGEAVAKYQEDVARHDELVAAKRSADTAKKEAVRAEIEKAVGQMFWVQEEGEDDGSGFIPVTETVEEVVYSDGRVGYVVGADDAGNLTMVYTDGTKGFSSRAEITDKLNSGEIVSDTPMGLEQYLEYKVDQNATAAEQTRMVEEQARSTEEMIATHPQGSVINVGTEEAKIEVPIIAPPTKDGVIVQMPDGTTPMLTWEDVAHAEKKEITPKTDAQINQTIVDEYRVSYTPVNPAEVVVSTQQKEEQTKRESPANPLPLKADGTVDQTALWNKDPERWAQWNDEQRQDGGANSLAYVSGAIAKEQAKIAELQAAYGAEADFDARDVIEKEIADTQARVGRLAAIQQNYAPLVLQQNQLSASSEQAPVVQAEPKPRERSVESEIARLYELGLSDEEVSANLDAKVTKAQEALDAQSKKAPKMGADENTYITKKREHQQKMQELQQKLDFVTTAKQAFSDIFAQQTQTPDNSGVIAIEEDAEPQNAVEFAARELGLKDGGIKLQRQSFAEHTGYGPSEMKKFFGLFKSKQGGGMTIEQAGERLMELDRENNTGFFDQNDSNAGLNAILDAIGAVNTIGELRSYVARQRLAEAQRTVDAAYSAMMAEYAATYGETMEESAHYDEVMRSGILMKGLSENEQSELNNIIFAEEISQNGTEEYQTEASGVYESETGSNATDVEPGAEGIYTGSSGVLQETQSDNSGRNAESQESQRRSEGEGSEQDALPSIPSGESAIAVESSLDEDMPDFTNSASAYFPSDEMKQKFSVMREKINLWSKKLGVKVRIMETLDDVVDQSAREAILAGKKVYGYFNAATGKVGIYLPDFLSTKGRELTEDEFLSEIDKTYIHEVVSHRGLRGLLGEEKYGELCDMVWDAMTEQQKAKFLNYPGVNGNSRIAADEFIAHFAEHVDYNDNRTLWDKILDFIKDWFNSEGLPTDISNESLADLLRQSYRNLAKSAAAIDINANKQAEGNTLLRAANGSLVGIHNISEEKLRKVIKQGGSANPSTAVIDIERQSFDSYGDISFIMPSSLVDAETGRNAGTFTADAWTPTYPMVERRFSDDKLQSAYWRDISTIPEEMSHEVRMAFDSWLDDRNASGLAYMFLHERGEAPEMVRIAAKFPQDIKDKLSAILGENRSGLYELSNEEKQAVLDLYIQENFRGNREDFDKSIADRIKRIEDRLSTGKVPSFVEKRITLDLQWMKEHGYAYDELSKFVDAIVSDLRHAGEVNDAATTTKSLDYIKENHLSDEFEQWKESLKDRYGIKEYLFDGYTPSGNQRWLPNTLENASRLMNKQGLAGATGMAVSFNRFVATLAPKKKTLSEIRASKDRLVEDDKLVVDFCEKWSEVFFDLGVKCQPDAKGYEEYGLERLTEAAQKKNPGAYLKKEYGVELSQEDLQKLSEMIKAIKTEFPARYFETKFQRPVYLNEFAAAVMPTTASEDIKQAVSEAGLPIFEYDSSVEGSRKEATLKATEGEGIRFRAIGEKGAANLDKAEDAQIQSSVRFRASNENQAIFVSNAARAVEGIKQEKATPEQWLKMIEKNGGLKAGEDKWMGLSDWLKASDKKTLTKAEVLDFINENMIVIEEEHYGEVELAGLQSEFDEIYDQIIDGVENGYEDEYDEEYEDNRSWEEIRDDIVMSPAEKAWEELNSRYHGGDDFDMAFFLDDRMQIQIEDPEAAAYFLGIKPINSTRLDYTTDRLTNKHEIALTVPTIDSWGEIDDVHFGDAGDGRAVAWIRFGETQKLLGTTEVNGKKKFNWAKVLVIDEIQSKRHQEGRDKGYRVANIDKWLKDNNVEVIETGEFFEFIKDGQTDRRFSKGLMQYDIEKAKRLYVNGFAKTDVPDAPFDKNWHELAMKRMLRYAAENGYDVIAWTKGEQQAERYNIGKVISGIYKREMNEEGMHSFEIRSYAPSAPRFITTDNNGKIIDALDNDAEEIQEYIDKNLSEVFGKELAQQMLGASEKTYISEEEMHIGGEGMKGFYDKMLPAFMNKYGKKWGVKVEDIKLPNLENGLTMHSVPVTEEMKASVMEGQVMFRTISITQEVQDEMDAISATAIVRGNYLKAPNGADTNLTPEQWAMVRTKAFKAWFGDWEKSARIQKLRNSEDASIAGDEIAPAESIDKKTALEYGKKLQGFYTNKDTGASIQLQRGRKNGGVNEVLQHNYKDAEHLQSIAAIPQIIEKSIFIESVPNADFEKNPDVVEYQHFVCGLKIGGEDYTVHSLVAVDKKGDRYYDHNLTAIEKKKLLDLIESQAVEGEDFGTTPGTQPTILSTYKGKQLVSLLQVDASKVVDANGEPKVVYHGTPNEFWSFDKDKIGSTNDSGFWGEGFYFTSQEALAVHYAEGGRVLPVFLNIRNPHDFAFFTKEYYDHLERFGMFGDKDFSSSRITEELTKEGKDGVIRRDSYGGHAEYVVFSPSQIKSATDNTGEFSTEDKDIRYRVMSDVNTNPTEAQKKAGNYKMGHIRLDGYNITIENPKGSVRRGIDSKGNAWENTLNNDYGYIRGTEGVDGDHIDVYLSDNPTEGNVFVIDQVSPETREFDEHKVMYGFNSAEEAREAYLANFSEGWDGLGTITEVSKDEFKKWIESSHRKTKPFSEYKSVRANEMQATDESELRYRVVSDQETLDRLNSEPTIKVYRAMQLIDGKLYPPMSAKVDGELRQPIELGQWEEAEERPDLVDEKGRFKLDKGNKSSLKARYNPYFHTSSTPLNDQFSSAQTRPELVTVEVEVPESELTSGYKAEKAKDSVGKLEWKAGVVQSKLSGTRTVILSRWDKPVRIVPDSEVADVIVDMFEGKDITMPSNVVTPSLRAELEKRGVPFVETDNQGNPVEEVSFRVTGTPTDEVVANGLQLTPAQTAEVAANIFAALPEESRKKITDGLNGNILGLKDAILQIPTSLATKENWNDEDRQMANAVAEEMTKMSGEMTRPFSAPEALWLLYNNLNKDTDLISQASRALVQRNLGFDAETLAKQEQAKEGVRFRTVGDATSNAQASLYNKGAVNVWTRLKESFVDMQASVEELVKAIEKRTGKVAQGFENILLALNQQPSKGFAAMEAYTQKFLNPMFDEIRRIMDATDFKYEDIVRHVILKHGLERNKKLAQRDAKAHYQEIYDDIIAKIKGMTDAQKRTYLTNAQLREADAKAELATLKAVDMSSMTDEEKREHKKKLAVARKAVEEAEEHLKRAQKIASMSEQEAKDELDKVFEKIENGTDSVYKEMRENDYSGISSMFYDQLGVDRKNFSTEEQYQAALMEAKKDKYSSLADVEAAAEAEVRVFEGLVDTKELWKRINACTKETLRQQYEANMISKDQYENLRNMFEYYVPLRGFKDNTAEDMYTYYRKPNSTGYTKPILGAEGRKTEAESPFGWIASMAGSAIASNVKNEAKLALYYFVSNRPNNGIATISRTWFVDSGEVDERGKKIFKPAYPPFSEDLSSDEAKARYESWQENMRELQKKGQAYEAGQRLNLGNAVVNISDANKPEHIVNVKVGGKDYTIIINGNPRAAQAINGDLNIEGTSQDYSALFGPVLRWMSSVNTSYNPEFWITNMMRDMAFTMMAVNIKEDPAYRRKFSKNYLKAFKVVSLVAKNENGTIGDSYLEQQYKDFVKYGGVTGYTQIKDSETWEKEIENYLSSNDPESIKSGKVMRGMKTAFHAAHRFGESLEQVSRFAAFLTARETGKSINEAINDAKEITVNFNRKGSGKMITLEEAKYLTDKNGQRLSKPEQWMVVGLSSIAPLGRRFIMFFNAAIQGLNATYKLMKKNPKRFTGWALGYAAVGMMNALLHAMMDDDDDYLDIPQYERRNSLMIGGNGAYFKWALPQESRAFYALGDLAVETIMGRNPHQNVVGEALKIGTEILPVNPSEGWKAFMPSIAIPLIELALNEDYKGSPIYNDQKWLSEEEKERTAKWSKAYQGTGWMYVKIAQGLNFVTGGDEHDAGLINLQPEKMEHLVQSAFGGTIRTADKFINTISAVIDPDEPWTVRQTPFLNRFLTINDERFKNVHVNDVFDYYKADAEHALTLEKQYIKDRDMDSLSELRSSDEYQWAKIYGKYKKPLKAIQEKIKVADGTAEKKELMKQQDELKKKMIKEISEL